VVLVNAGDGKGKTSAVMDVAMRSLARGWRVAIDRPVTVDLVLTGSDVPKEIIEIADTVTDIQDVKHAFEQGIPAMKGISF